MSTILFAHRGVALKVRAVQHIISAMWSLPECMPEKRGSGPKDIGHRAGFNFHSEYRRQYARGLILEAVDSGFVEAVPIGAVKNFYRLVCKDNENREFYVPYLDAYYITGLEKEGASIIAEAKNLVIDCMKWVEVRLGQDEHRSNTIEDLTGMCEHRNGKTYRGYWGWLIVEELIHDEVLVRLPDDGKFRMIKFK
jgi:hypothetical protein